MLIRIGFLLASYIGARAYSNYKNKKEHSRKALKTAAKSHKSLSQLTNIEESDKLCDRYFKAGTVSLGVAVLARTIPSLYIFSLGLIIYTCIPILRRGERQLLERHTAGHDLLYSTYIILAFLTRQEMYIALGVFFYHSGAKMLSMNRARSQPLISSLMQQQPDKVWILKDGVEIEMPLEEVSVGDMVVIRAGEVVPVDGIIIEGLAMIDQHALTGEAQPVEKEANESVFSSTLLVAGQVKVKVTKAGSETTISKITGILNNTSAYTTSIQLKGEKWANIIAKPILGLTIVTIPTLGLMTATTVSHSTFGNRLRIVAPIGTLNYLHSALGKGLLIKDGRVIEELDKVDTVLFDKTGTLTYEQPDVGEIISFDEQYSTNDILTFAATAEHKLTHPIALAIRKKAEQSRISMPFIQDSSFTMGYGITVMIENQLIRVGSARFMEMENITITQPISSAMEQSHVEGYSLVMIAVDDAVAGAIQIVSTLRPEVKEMLRGLRKRGIKHISIVSGDHKNPTRKLAESLGMDSYFYEVLPQQKAEIVEQLQRQGKTVCFVGDGINDAIAMNTANVSVSLSGATSIATDTAQAVLMDGSLTHLCDLFDVAHKLKNNLWRSLVLVTIPSVISLTGALFWGLRLGCSFLIIYSSFAVALGNAMLPMLESKTIKKHTKAS
jgi:Cu2+-exporting ATPase